MGYTYLAIAIVAEVIGTSSLKASDGFTQPGPTALALVGYLISFYFLALVLKTIPVGVAYAIWAGVGIALITLVGVFLFKQVLDLPAVIGIGLIIAGVAVINLYSKSLIH